jgi:hypothetical protein
MRRKNASFVKCETPALTKNAESKNSEMRFGQDAGSQGIRDSPARIMARRMPRAAGFA